MPANHHEEPTVNAILNVAEAITKLAEATDGLLYGLKFSKREGMSIAEAIEVSASKLATSIELLDGLSGAVQDCASALEAKRPALDPEPDDA